MRAALSARVLHPLHTLLRMILPDILPAMPITQIAMARKAQAQVIFLKRAASFISDVLSAVVTEAGTIIITLSRRIDPEIR
jgi:hypothetical protein